MIEHHKTLTVLQSKKNKYKISVVHLYLPSSSVRTTTSGLIAPQPTLVKPSTLIPYLVYFHNPVNSRLVWLGPSSSSLYVSSDSFMVRR